MHQDIPFSLRPQDDKIRHSEALAEESRKLKRDPSVVPSLRMTKYVILSPSGHSERSEESRKLKRDPSVVSRPQDDKIRHSERSEESRKLTELRDPSG